MKAKSDVLLAAAWCAPIACPTPFATAEPGHAYVVRPGDGRSLWLAG